MRVTCRVIPVSIGSHYNTRILVIQAFSRTFAANRAEGMCCTAPMSMSDTGPRYASERSNTSSRAGVSLSPGTVRSIRSNASRPFTSSVAT